MRKEITIAVLIVLVLSAVYFLNVGATGFSTASEDVPVDEKVLSEVGEKGKTSVVVFLKEPKPKIFRAKSAKSLQQDVLATLKDDEFKKGHEYSIIKGFSGEVTSDGLEKLRHNPNVERVYFDKTYTLSLGDSVPLVNASKMHPYQINGLNITGVGETICMLDTGINYTHESLGGCTEAQFLSGSCEKVPGGYDYVNNDADPYDDHGHGTHVSGIAAANGNVVGVAPGAKIVMIKVCDSGGSCLSSNILSGLEWCTTNKDVFNISVISLSLGDGGQYTSTTCPSDSIDAGLASAYSAGIFIVASSGNNHYTSGISHPACNENVTSAGAVTKSDGITYNRGGDLLTILAPGVSIISTYYNGGTATASGTSMSAPHIAGAAAVLQQYAKASSGVLTQEQIRTALNSTGRTIYDSSSGGTYARISVYEAVKSLTDVLGPSLSIVSPLNTVYDTNVSLSLDYITNDINDVNSVWYNIDGEENITVSGSTSFNTTEGLHTLNLYANDTFGNENIAQVSFTIDLDPKVEIYSPQNITYATGTDLEFSFAAADTDLDSCWYNIDDGENVALDSCANTTLDVSEGSHDLKLFANDSGNNEAWTEVSFTADLTGPVVYLDTPVDSSFSNSKNIVFKFKATDTNLDSCKLYGDWDGWHVNQTKTGMISDSLTSFDDTALEDGNHTWNVECFDIVGHSGFNDTNYTLAIDTLSPIIVVTSPVNTTYLSSTSLALDFSISEDNLDSCWYSLNEGSNTTISNCENTTLSISTEQNGLKVYAKDLAGNEVVSDVSFVADVSYPLISLSSPSEGISLQSPAGFNYTVAELSVANCSLLINGTVNMTDDSITSDVLQDFSAELTADRYYWSVRCVDNGGRENVSEERNIKVCNENWNCTEWSTCSSSLQARTCTDLNGCGTTYSKSSESQSCSTESSSAGSESTAGAAGSQGISGGEVEDEIETPKPEENLPEKGITEEKPKDKPAETKETAQNVTEETKKGFMTKALDMLKGLKDWITSPKTVTNMSTRAVEGVKTHKIAVSGFVFVIFMMIFAQFYFLKKYKVGFGRRGKGKDDLPDDIPRPDFTAEDVKKPKGSAEPPENDVPIKKDSFFKRLDLFKGYKDLFKPKNP